MKYRAVILVLLMVCGYAQAEERVLLPVDEFVARSFADGSQVERQTLWVSGDMRDTIRDNIDYSLSQLRLRYWAAGERTAWVLEEIGKERPITMGIVVEDSQIQDVAILVYRESRGGEVKYPFFTDQFLQATIDRQDDRFRLTNQIDGITGATLSVRAVKKVATLALFLHQQTPYAADGPN